MANPEYITYLVSALPTGCWFVDSSAGTSGYSFQSLADAERFAIALAKRNVPSKVSIVSLAGEVVDERIFDEPSANRATRHP